MCFVWKRYPFIFRYNIFRFITLSISFRYNVFRSITLSISFRYIVIMTSWTWRFRALSMIVAVPRIHISVRDNIFIFISFPICERSAYINLPAGVKRPPPVLSTWWFWFGYNGSRCRRRQRNSRFPGPYLMAVARDRSNLRPGEGRGITVFINYS